MGSRERALIHGFPNGETHLRPPSLQRQERSWRWIGWGQQRVFVPESIGNKGEPGELKHLSTRRKGHQRDSVSSGERKRTRPVPSRSSAEPSGKAGPRG